MLQKFFTFLILMGFFVMGISQAQEPPPPVLGSGEHYTHLWSVTYDYQTNGSVRYLAQDPANRGGWCAILMAQHDSTTPAGTQRYIYYAYSDDNGASWTSDVLTTAQSHGFPCMTIRNGIPVIADHSSGLGCFVWQDALWGAFSFSQLPAVPTLTVPPIWPHISATANGNLVLIGSPNTTGAFDGNTSTFNGTTWSPWRDLGTISGPSGNYDVSANANGKASIFGVNYNPTTLEFSRFASADNGVTFDNGTQIFPYIIVGADTLFTSLAGGYQSTYVGDEVHVVLAAYNNTAATFFNANRTEFVNPSIYHWSASTGLTKVAAKSNIPNLSDTITQVNVEPLCQPTITRMPSGKLVCAYTAFLWGHTQIVNNGDTVNAGDILVSTSNDNGATWSIPANLTNTPNIEEKHASLAPNNNSDSLRITYVRDLKAGAWVNVVAWGAAPVYNIFYTGLVPTSIHENVTQAKTYELFQNYPNPFNPSTTISYYIQKNGYVSLKVYDIVGREVATLVNEVQTQGPKQITFNASSLSSGIYYYTVTAGDFKDTKKMMLIK